MELDGFGKKERKEREENLVKFLNLEKIRDLKIIKKITQKGLLMVGDMSRSPTLEFAYVLYNKEGKGNFKTLFCLCLGRRKKKKN